MPKYEEQLDRIRRWFYRIWPLMEQCTTVFDRDAETYADDFHAFFVECHSMKDWLANDPDFPRKGEIKAYIENTPSLRVCADLANGKKHLVLTDRWSKDAAIDGLTFSFVVLEGDASCSTGNDLVGADQANKTRQKWLDCEVDPKEITISVFCDPIIHATGGGSSDYRFDGAIDLAWEALEAWCRFVEPKDAGETSSRGKPVQTDTVKDGQRVQGTIKKLMDRGFGFITIGGNTDLFFHRSSLCGVSFEKLCVGQKVSCTKGRGPKGPRAEDVKLM